MIRDLLRYLSLVLVAATLTPTAQSADGRDPLVFVSAFAAGEKGGIHAYQLDLKTGTLKEVHRTAGVENPFFLALSPDHKYLYSIHGKTFGGKEHEQVAAYQLAGRTGKMKLLNRQSALGSA